MNSSIPYRRCSRRRFDTRLFIVEYDEYGLRRFRNAKRTHKNYKAMKILQKMNTYETQVRCLRCRAN